MSDDLDLVRRAVEAGETIAAEKNRLIWIQEVRIAQLKTIKEMELAIAFCIGSLVGALFTWWFG